MEHQLLEIDGASIFPRVTLEPGAPPKGPLTIPLRLREGVTAPTEVLPGMLTIHYVDASNGQVYWQPWRCLAGAKSDKGPFFELGRPGAVDTDGVGQSALLRRILRHMLDQTDGRLRRMQTDKIAAALGLEVFDVGMGLDALERRGCVAGIRVDQEPYPILAELTSEGVIVAKDGWPETPARGGGTVYNTTFTGDVKNAAVGNQGPTFQFAGDRTELRQVADELRRALTVDTALPAEDRNDALDALDQVDEELALEKPRRRRLISARDTLSLVADAAGAAQGALMVRDGIQTVLPLIEALLRSAG